MSVSEMTRSLLWTNGLLLIAVCLKVCVLASDGGAVFIREFTLIRRDHLAEDSLQDNSQKTEDLSSRTARSEEDRDTLWDAWGSWSDCSRTCGGGASYALRRCLSSKTCEGQNIKYRTCSNVDCPSDSGDFRAQQCSAHADVRYQGQYHEWLPVDNDPDNPCALKCKAKGSALVVELAPKVLDGTRCYTESLDTCISGACQVVGCDYQLGSTAREDNCGVCNGDGSSCRLTRGHYKSQHASGKVLESTTLQGVKAELSLDKSGQYNLENTTLDFQKLPDKKVLRIPGPLRADFTIKVQYISGADSVVQFIYYQPITHRWRETDFFPCSVSCGGGYQLTSAECFDLRGGQVVADQYCHYYPENVKPKPKLRECNMDPCLASDGYKQIMPYDLYHPLPRWESSPWTACSASCGGGVQSRSVSCVEEDVQGTVAATEEWKCLYSPRAAVTQPCNAFHCPTWQAQDWSPCTVTCGQGLRYRVVLCLDHRGLHAGGCSPATKPHIKEECLVTVPCFKPIEELPVEAKPIWHKQAIELEEEQVTASEEPMFIPGPWQACSRTCGVGSQRRSVRCQVLLSFSQAVAHLPEDECGGERPSSTRPCYRSPCPTGGTAGESAEERGSPPQREELLDWEYQGFTECSESCGGGVQEAVVICLNKQTSEQADQSQCERARRPPQLLQDCNTQACPPRWETGSWSPCSAPCGVGLTTRSVACTQSTGSVGDEQCPGPRPSPAQACNRFDCTPAWEPQGWGECSHSCGGGLQAREVLCQQHLADGSAVELPDTFCPADLPLSKQACARQACPPRWTTTDWSQCSVSCGQGVQTRHTACRGQHEDIENSLAVEACMDDPRPTSTRPCFLQLCDKATTLEASKPAGRKVYIQWRKAKKLHLVAGGYAYLLPWTSVVLHCPASRFHKGALQWLKEGRPLLRRPHIHVTPLGYVKIRQLGEADVGVYTCAAGGEREHFVLKVIGSKRKLSPLAEGGGGGGAFSLDRYDDVVQSLLRFKASNDAEKNRPASDLSGPLVLTAEAARLDELAHDLSDGPEGPGALRRQLAQLLRELSVEQGESNESTLHPPDKEEASTPGSLVEDPDTQGQDLRPRGPVITQRPGNVGGTGSSEVVVQVGMPVVLQRQVASVQLKCDAMGHPQPSIIWTKNGRQLHYNSRTSVLSDGSLRILSPGRTDEGLYTCTAHNPLGSTSVTSRLQATGQNCLQGHGDGSICTEKNVSSRSLELCHGEACPFRWQVAPWSLCSASCGGGVQARRVTCVRGDSSSSGGEEAQDCASAGRRPPELTRSCNPLPCTRWATGPWGPCQGRCVGFSLATRHRHVYCQELNGTKLPYRMCSGLQSPSSFKNCSSEACALQWNVGPWTQCTATCGRHGFQSRQVTCAHRHTGTASPERHCAWRPRPPGWQRCNIPSCGKAGKCRDSTRYCDKVRKLDLCPLPQFKSRCCQSCRDT